MYRAKVHVPLEELCVKLAVQIQTQSHGGRQCFKKVGSFVSMKKITLVYQKEGNAFGPLYVLLYKSEMTVILRKCQILFSESLTS
jgi:hypothetical protein